VSLVELARYNTRVEADVARLTLESHEIDAVLFDAEMHSYLGVGFLMPVRLMVLEEDRAAAALILTEGGLLPPG
jgi:hypothetical protein